MNIALKSFAALVAAGAALVSLGTIQPAGAYVLGPSSPGKWGSPEPGTGATVTWSYMPGGLDCAEGDGPCTTVALSSFMPVGFQSVIEAAFNAWSSVANLTFVQVADSGLAFDTPGAGGDIRLAGHAFDGPFGVLAHGYYPPANGNSAAGDIHFDIDETWDLTVEGDGFSIFYVMAHELGHALGLRHTEVPNSLMNAYYTEAYTGPQADDIAGIQYLYGAPVATPEPLSLAILAGGLLGLGIVQPRTR